MLFIKHDSGFSQSSKSFVINDYNNEKMFVDVSGDEVSIHYDPMIAKVSSKIFRLKELLRLLCGDVTVLRLPQN